MFAVTFFLSGKKREGKKGAVNMPKQHTDSLLGIQDTLLRYYWFKDSATCTSASENKQNQSNKWKIRK